MTGDEVRKARLGASLTQKEVAAELGITQAYLSMVERGVRAVSPELAHAVLETFSLPPTALPLRDYFGVHDGEFDFKQALGSLGYPGYAYLGGTAKVNPAEFLMRAIDSDDLDSRVTEGLPWVVASFPLLNWDWLFVNAKIRNRQNRLAFIISLASEVARNRADSALETELSERVAGLERSRLAMEDTLCKASMTQAERRWLRTRRTPLAAHWNLLADLTLDHVDYEPI